MVMDSAASRLGTIGSGTLVTMRTVRGSTIDTSWPNDGGHVSLDRVLSFEWMARSMVNLTHSALNSSPLWNLMPLRSLISHVFGLRFFTDSASSGLISMVWGSRVSRPSPIRLMIEPLSTERNWCGSIVSGVDGYPMVTLGFLAWARAVTGCSAASAAAAPACLNRSRRVGIGSNPPRGRESAGRILTHLGWRRAERIYYARHGSTRRQGGGGDRRGPRPGPRDRGAAGPRGCAGGAGRRGRRSARRRGDTHRRRGRARRRRGRRRDRGGARRAPGGGRGGARRRTPRHPGQQRGGQPQRAHLGDVGGGLGLHAAAEPPLHLPLHPRRGAAHDEAPLRPHRVHLL